MTEDWEKAVAERTVTREEALEHIKDRMRVFVGSGAGEPRHLVEGLVGHLAGAESVELIQPYTLPSTKITEIEFGGGIRANACIVSDAVRTVILDGQADYTPVLPSLAPDLMRSRKLPIDVALVTVSPADEHGFFSLGVAVDVTRTATETARFVIAQVNARMPRVFGPALIHASEIDLFVVHREALPELQPAKPFAGFEDICTNLHRLIPDGATLQVGAGRLTDAILLRLKDKRDLGLHCELFTDGAMKLARAGVLNGRRKTLHPGRMVAAAAAGSRGLYKFLDRNPAVELHPSDYVNSPLLVARNFRMVAVNLGEAVDLTGQASSGLYGPDYLSGPPGRADFMRGAAQAKDGKAILALPSTREDEEGETRSRIVPGFPEGTEVLLTRSDVQYVVTEHGIAYLLGKSLRERALALIAIAHPDFRDELTAAARARRIIHPDQPIPDFEPAYPKELERWITLKDGTEVLLRPIKPEDGDLMKDLFYALSDETLYFRFHQMVKEMPQRGRQAFFKVDYREELTLVAVLNDDDTESFLGSGRFALDEGTGTAETAFVVRDEWQGKGLGGQIFTSLAEIARDRGILTLTAEILAENRPMLRVMEKGGYEMSTQREAGIVHVEVSLET